MIKFLTSIGLSLMLSVSMGWSLSWDDVKDDLKDNTRMTLGQGIIPAYYANFRTGQSKGVGLTSVFAYRYLHAAVGIAHGFQKEQKGEGLGGTLLRVDEFIGHNFPWVRGLIDRFTPESAQGFLDRFYFGYALSWDFDRGAPGHGIISGFEISF